MKQPALPTIRAAQGCHSAQPTRKGAQACRTAQLRQQLDRLTLAVAFVLALVVGYAASQWWLAPRLAGQPAGEGQAGPGAAEQPPEPAALTLTNSSTLRVVGSEGRRLPGTPMPLNAWTSAQELNAERKRRKKQQSSARSAVGKNQSMARQHGEDAHHRHISDVVAWEREQERMQSVRLDALIAEELRYDPDAPAPAGRSPTAFKLLPEATAAAAADVRAHICPALEQPDDTPMHEKRKMLFILGTQKGGTTYLFHALSKHHSFVGAQHAFGQRRGVWAKEVHFFNRWPQPDPAKLEYLRVFPSFTWAAPSSLSSESSQMYTLLDATPDYMFNSMSAPRIKAMWPQAKFVVLLRDPVARVYSAWKMGYKMACKRQAKLNPHKACVFPSFADVVLEEIATLKKSGCTFSRKGGLYAKTWADCYKCQSSFVDRQTCERVRMWNKQPCSTPPFLTLSVSHYAAQLSWWFAHFPRDRFMVVRSNDLHTREPLDILNEVIRFMNLTADPFQAYMLRKVWGYAGAYNRSDISPLELKTMRFLRLFYRQAEADLGYLLGPQFSELPQDLDVSDASETLPQDLDASDGSEMVSGGWGGLRGGGH